MRDADAEAVIRTIQDPACVYLQQHLTTGGAEVFDPDKEIPAGRDFIRMLPEKHC